MQKQILAPLAVAAALTAGAANAGGYIAPVVQDEIPVIVAPVVTPTWQGAYLGGTLGYACCGDDRVGFHTAADAYRGDIGTLEIGGFNGGLRAGYRWQRDQWVFGPELGYEIGRISDDLTYTGTYNNRAVTGEASNDVNSVLALRFKTGRLVDENTLVYGIAGLARGNFDYEVRRTSAITGGTEMNYGRVEGMTMNGYVLGLGAERRVNERMSLTGEWEYANFGSKDVQVGNLTTVATPKYHNFRIGLNYRF